MINHPGQPITTYDVAQIVGNAFPLAFTPKNIIAGFRDSGISPFNLSVFSDEEFLCSYVADQQPVVIEETPLQSAYPVVEVTEHHRPAPDAPHPIQELLRRAPDVTATHMKAPEEITCTSTNTGECIFTPRANQSIPKAPPCKNKGGRKKDKTIVLADTPTKEQTRDADEER